MSPHQKRLKPQQQQPHYIRLNPQQTIDIYPLFFCFYSIETTGTVLAHIELIYGEMTAIALMAILFY